MQEKASINHCSTYSWDNYGISTVISGIACARDDRKTGKEHSYDDRKYSARPSRKSESHRYFRGRGSHEKRTREAT